MLPLAQVLTSLAREVWRWAERSYWADCPLLWWQRDLGSVPPSLQWQVCKVRDASQVISKPSSSSDFHGSRSPRFGGPGTPKDWPPGWWHLTSCALPTRTFQKCSRVVCFVSQVLRQKYPTYFKMEAYPNIKGTRESTLMASGNNGSLL